MRVVSLNFAHSLPKIEIKDSAKAKVCYPHTGEVLQYPENIRPKFHTLQNEFAMIYLLDAVYRNDGTLFYRALGSPSPVVTRKGYKVICKDGPIYERSPLVMLRVRGLLP